MTKLDIFLCQLQVLFRNFAGVCSLHTQVFRKIHFCELSDTAEVSLYDGANQVI